MKFKKFINEEAEIALLVEGVKEEIIIGLDSMDKEDISGFGEFIEDLLNAEDVFDDEEYTKEEVIELIGELDAEDLDYALYMMGTDEFDTEEEDESMDEKTSRVLKAGNRNRGKKRFTKSKAELRKGKGARKKENRTNKVSRKKYRNKNKVNLKKYAKSYGLAVASGKHIRKIRR